jgi:5-methylcytosine-specific restriction protein A
MERATACNGRIMAKRLNFTRKTLRHGYERAHGCCEKCKATLKKGEGEGDHILPAELGGTNDLSNLQILCRVCHKESRRRSCRAERARDKATGAVRAKSALSRPKEQKPQGKASLPPRRLFQ